MDTLTDNIFLSSPYQARVWSLQDPAAPFLAWASLRLSGPVDEPSVRRALHQTVDRHESLRTRLVSLPGSTHPMQRILDPEQGLAFDVVSLAEATDDARTAERTRFLDWATEALVGEKAPTCVARLLLGEEDGEEATLILATPATNADHASLATIFSDFADALFGTPTGEAPLQYADISEWLREQFDEGDEAAKAWRADLDPTLLDPSPALRIGQAGRRGAPMITRRLPPPPTSRITPAVALACWVVLLSRLTNRDAVMVGVGSTDRSIEDLDGVVGGFERFLPLSITLDGDAPFAHVVDVATEGLAALPDRMFDGAAPALNGSGAAGPAFTFFHRALPAPRQSGPLRVTLERTVCRLDRSELHLDVSETEDGLDIEIHFASDAHDDTTAAIIAAQLALLLDAAGNPETAPRDMAMDRPMGGSTDESSDGRALAFTAPARRAPPKGAGRDLLHQLFEDWVDHQPNAPAVSMGSECWSYAELDGRAEALARRLAPHMRTPETLVGLCLGQSLEFVTGMLAILKAGGAFLPLDPRLPLERLEQIIEDAEPALTLTTATGPLDPSHERHLVLDGDALSEGEHGLDRLDKAGSGDGLAYVIYTSGSTGGPKGVRLPHRAASHYTRAILERLDPPPGARFASLASPAADLWHTALFGSLCGGGHLILVPTEEQLDPDALITRFGEQPPDYLKIVPSHLAALLSMSPEGESTRALLPHRHLVFGGEALPRDLTERIRGIHPDCRMINHYGPTETTVGALTLCLNGEDDGMGATVPIGLALPGYRLHITDAALRPVFAGSAGELLIGGPALARDYLGQPETTGAAFVPDPVDPATGPVYRTGDLVRLKGNGTVEFLGRTDDQIKIRGFRVEPAEVRAALIDHPDIQDAAVIPYREASGDTGLAAYVVPRPDSRPDGADLRDFVANRLPPAMVPSAVTRIEALPLLANGKLNRAALPPIDQESGHGAKQENHVPPEGEIEEVIARVWARLLDLERVGRHDDFFSIGGHSLLATQVVAQLRKEFGSSMTVRTLFEHNTVARLAAWIAPRADGAEPEGEPLPHLPEGGPHPLSFSQRRLWVLDQIEGEGHAYNVPAAIRIRGPLDIDALRWSLNAIVGRHGTLRTRFLEGEDGPLQVVEPRVSVDLPLIETTEEALPSLIREHAATAFDLRKGPLLAVALARLAPEEHVLLFRLHHIISDGWSSGILIRELAQWYETHRATPSGPPTPPALDHQYVDYAHWERNRLAKPEARARLDHWLERLSGAPPLLELPTDRPRPRTQSFRGEALAVQLPPPLSAALGELAQDHGATLFMLLTAAFRVLLSRYTGQDDICIGSPVANRNRVELDGMIGCFINTLVLRGRVDPSQGFLDHLTAEKTLVLDALVDQDVPFERIVEELAPERDLGHTPLFQAMVILQNAPRETLRLSDLSLDMMDIPWETTKFDLTLDLVETPEGLGGRLEYATDLFDRGTMERLLAHFRVLLEGLVADPTRPVGDLPLAPPSEYRTLFATVNDTAAPSSTTPLHEQFSERALSHPDRTALVAGANRLTYGELEARSNRLARHLSELGAGAETTVGLCLERGLDMVVAALAILKAGAAYIPLDPLLPTARLAIMAEESQPLAVITDRKSVNRLPEGPWRSLRLDTLSPLLATLDARPPAVSVKPADLAYILFTSGSTGRPKGVMVEHGQVANFFLGMDRCLPEGPATWLAATSLSFDIAVLELFWTLCRGQTTVIRRDDRPLDPNARDDGAAEGDALNVTAADDRPMAFSLFYFSSDSEQTSPDKYRLLTEGARFADENGFSAVWTPERHFGQFGGLYPNPSITSAAIATITKTVSIRTGSLVLPLHNPIRVAEDWAMIDNLSGGRVSLSFSTGWQPHDFALAPDRFHDRKDVTYKGIDIVRRLWRGETIPFRGGTGEVPIRTLPRPIQPELPFWITAAGNPDTFLKAGELGANLLTHLLGQTVEQLAERIALYRAAWREAGHPGKGTVALMLHTFITDDPTAVDRMAREPFKEYLRGAIDLVTPLAAERGLNLDDFSDEDLDALLDHATDRYFVTSGLFGTPRDCQSMVTALKGADVDDIACLIDFGIENGAVLDNLKHLDHLRRLAQPDGIESGGDREGDEVEDSVEALITKQGVTHFQCTPTLARLLVGTEEGRAALGHLDCLLVGGEALSDSLAEALRDAVKGQVFNMYGPTETTIWSLVDPVSDGPVTIGRPIANTEIHLVDALDNPQAPGLIGELLIGGTGVSRGYVGRPELTAERFVHLPELSPNRLYRTGDLVRLRPDNRLEFRGRVDDQVKVNGFRIELGDVEAALASHPDIAESAVTTRPNEAGLPILVAYVVVQSGRTAEGLEPRHHLLRVLPQYAIPTRFVFLEALPRTIGGKVDRKALTDPGPERASQNGGEDPRDAMEGALVGLWSTLLGLDRVGIHDNFFSLGGDSIIAIQMVTQARRQGLEVTPRQVFQNQTIARLAPLVTRLVGAPTDDGVEDIGGEVPLTPIQHWFFEQDLAHRHHYNQSILVGVDASLSAVLVSRALDWVIRRHPILSLRFHASAEGWRQTPPDAPVAPFAMDRVDLRDLPPSDRPARIEALANDLHASLDLGAGPLLRGLWIDGADGEAPALLVVVHHLVVDGISWRVLVEDLRDACLALARGEAPTAPPPTASFAAWSRAMEAFAASPDRQPEVAYWQDSLAGSDPSLPMDRRGENTEASTETVSIHLDGEETKDLLHETPRAYNTRINDLLLSALVMAFAPWTGRSSLLVDLESHGREDSVGPLDLSHSVGWFTALFPVHLKAPPSGDVEDTLKAIKEELRRVPSGGVGFGAIKYLSPNPENREALSSPLRPPVIFNYLGQADVGEDGPFRLIANGVGTHHAPDQTRSHLLNINAIVSGGCLRVDFTFSTNIHDRETIKTLAQAYQRALSDIRTHCASTKAGFTPSDFSMLDMDQAGLDDLLSELEELE